MRTLFCALVLSTLAFGQTSELKDWNCRTVLSISDVKMPREDIPVFRAAVKNISGEDFDVGTIRVTVYRWIDRSKAEFTFTVGNLAKDSTITISPIFSSELLLGPKDFELGRVEFALAGSGLCREVKRAAEAASQAAKVRRKRKTGLTDSTLRPWRKGMRRLRLLKQVNGNWRQRKGGSWRRLRPKRRPNRTQGPPKVERGFGQRVAWFIRTPRTRRSRI